MSQKVYVYGAGGHGKVVATVLQAQGFSVEGFIDDEPTKCKQKFLGLPVLKIGDLVNASSIIVGIGDNRNRKKIFTQLNNKRISLVSAMHPSGVLHPSVKVGKGTVVMAGVIVNVDSTIGENVILNTGVCVDHDCVISPHSHLAPGVVLAGHVTIGEGAFLGIGVRVVPGVQIGAWSTVGAGAVVLENVPEGKTVVGIPAKEIGN